MQNFYIPNSAMVITAHPDDIEFICAGTIARWVKTGTRVAYVICTSGDVGIAEKGITRQQATEIREAESRAAAATVGVNNLVFLREPDGLLEATLDLRKKLVREIRRFRPEVLITQDPTIIFAGETYLNHPDHRAAGLAALDAVFPAAGQPHLFDDLEKEGLTAHKTRKVYVGGWQQNDLFVNIGDEMDLKVAALHAHKSQFKDWNPEPYLRERGLMAAKGKEMSYAETFRVITLIDDETWQKNAGG